MQIISELEGYRRGTYARRRRLRAAGRRRSTRASRSARSCCTDGVAHLQAGAGIVADSDPAAEHEECLRKLAALETAMTWRRQSVILLVDNYDSFTYNLAHLFQELGAEVVVRRNDAIDADEAERLRPSHLVVSPGPGRPEDSGATLEIVRRLAPTTPTLGVCLGHQAIVAGVRRRDRPGAASSCTARRPRSSHDGRGIFAGLPQDFQAGRYHSLAATQRARACSRSRRRARRRGDGRAPPRAADRRRAVPPRVGAHPARAATSAANFLERDDPGRAATAARRRDARPRRRRARRWSEIMAGEATPAQIGGFLVALRVKGETADEIAGCAEAMREHGAARRAEARPTSSTRPARAATAQATLNISTAAALVAAAAGAGVAKHGNRAVSSASGSADVLEALGFDARARRRSGSRARSTSSASASCSRRRTIPGLRHAAPVRRELATRTVFNVLGPLTNPAGARAQVVGVYDAGARAHDRRGARRGSARSARSSSTAPAGSTSSRRPGRTSSARSRRRGASSGEIDPRDLGIVPRCAPRSCAAARPSENAAAIRAVFSGRSAARSATRSC